MRRNEFPHYGMLSALVLSALCAADVVRGGAGLSPRSWTVLLLLACVLGALHGIAFRGALFALGRGRPNAQTVVLALAGSALGFGLARSLNAFARLDSPYRKLALLVLGACAGIALASTLLGLALAPGRYSGQGRALAWRAPYRLALALLLAALAAACFRYEPRYYPGEYPSAHTALRIASLWLGLAALALTRVDRALRLAPRQLALVAVACPLLLALSSALWPRSVDELVHGGDWPLSLLRMTRHALDFDHDGYAKLLGGGDCNDADPAVHPGAHEIPGNGIDDNCILGDAKAQTATPAPPKRATEPSPNDVVVIIVDSLRPDHVGAFNPKFGVHGRNTTPNIDAWAAQNATAFDHVYATGGWTSISVPSLMRGLYPRRLTWTRSYEMLSHILLREDQVNRGGEPVLQMFPLAWRDPQPTLAELFRLHGMRTIAIVDDGWSRMLSQGTGVERDFDVYRVVDQNPVEQSDAGTVTLIEQELLRAPKDQRLFLWAHFFGVHSINEVHPGIQDYGPSMADGYDHEVRFFDSLWPRIWAAIHARGDNVVTVLTSDHGEVFYELARMHGFTASEADLRVPLFIHVPGGHPKHVAQLCSTIDLFPTLLAQTRTPAPERIDGIDLEPWIFGTPAARPRMLLADTWRYTADAQPIVDLVAALDGHTKLLLNAVDQNYSASDVSHTPETPSAVDAPGAEALRPFLDAYVEAAGGALDPKQ